MDAGLLVLMPKSEFLLIVTLALACDVQPHDNQVLPHLNPAEERALRTTISAAHEKQAVGLMSGDVDAIVSVYANDAVVLPANSTAVRGLPAIAEFNAALLREVSFSEVNFATSGLLVEGDLVIETGTYTMVIRPKGAAAVADTGKFMSVWRRVGEQKLEMLRDIFNTDLPPIPPQPHTTTTL